MWIKSRGKVKKLTVASVSEALTIGIRSERLQALAEKISMYEAKVKRDLLRDGCRPPLTST